MKNLIINLAPSGIVPTKKLTPQVPIEPEEVIADVLQCAALGVSMVHLHARDGDGKPTYKKEHYSRIIDGIRRERPDLVLIVSTSGRIFNDFDKRSEVLDLEGYLKPDMASLTPGSINFNKTSSLNSPDIILKLLEKMQQKGVKPELEIFDLGMVNYVHYLIKKGLISPPYYFNIILGNIAGAQGKLLHLGLIVSELPDESYWSVACIGDCKNNIHMAGVIYGDGIRIGIEDNIWHDDARTILSTNISVVERVVKLATLIDRGIASPVEVRQMLNL